LYLLGDVGHGGMKVAEMAVMKGVRDMTKVVYLEVL
jgi:hypothetical protein